MEIFHYFKGALTVDLKFSRPIPESFDLLCFVEYIASLRINAGNSALSKMTYYIML